MVNTYFLSCLPGINMQRHVGGWGQGREGGGGQMAIGEASLRWTRPPCLHIVCMHIAQAHTRIVYLIPSNSLHAYCTSTHTCISVAKVIDHSFSHRFLAAAKVHQMEHWSKEEPIARPPQMEKQHDHTSDLPAS